MRRLIVIVSVSSAAALVAGVAVEASTERGTQVVNRQSLAWASTASSSTWADLPGLTAETSCPFRSMASAALSVEIAAASAPVQVRVVRTGITINYDPPVVLQPGAVTVTAAGGSPSAATFIFGKRRIIDGHGEDYRVQWRSPTRDVATIDKATLKIDWAHAGGTCR
jgi:hypothetical protein